MHEISHHAKEENNQWKNPKIVKIVFEVKALENTKLKLKNSLFTFTRSILRDAKRRSNWEQIYPASCRGCTIVHSSSKID